MIQTWNKFCFSQSGIVEMKADPLVEVTPNLDDDSAAPACSASVKAQGAPPHPGSAAQAARQPQKAHAGHSREPIETTILLTPYRRGCRARARCPASGPPSGSWVHSA